MPQLKFRITLYLPAMLLLLSSCVSQQKVKKKPNIIYILADDMGYGDIGCYGQKEIRTPNIDTLAKHGMKFTQHYAGAPVCAPSRCVLMTGRDAGHARVRGNYETGPNGFGAGLELRDEDFTLGEMLKERGYTTAVVGKWGMGVSNTSGEPNKQGFDYSYGFLNQGHAHYQFPDYLYRNGEKIEISENKNERHGAYSNTLFTEEAIKFIGKKQKSPFFLYLAFTTPHAELLVPDDSIFNSYKGRFPETPYIKKKGGSNGHDDFGAYGSQDYPKAAYATSISHQDQCVGKLIQYLKDNGLYENTVIMFSSDNGPSKEGGIDPYFFQSTGGLRGIKRDVYEGGIREPLVVSWPAKIKAGTTSAFKSAFYDIMPTLADISGKPLHDTFATEGVSLLPLLLGKNAKIKEHPYLYWEFHENKTSDQAIRKDDWKAIRHDPNGPIELYNLKEDEKEQHDVAAMHPEIIAQMKTLFNNARTANEYWPLKTAKDSTGNDSLQTNKK